MGALAALFGALLVQHAAAAAVTATLDGPDVRAIVVVADTDIANRTYISELYLKREAALATSNLAFNYSQKNWDMSTWSHARLSSTAMSFVVPPSPTFCGLAAGPSPPVRSLTLSCLSPAATMHILFAAYGTPDVGGCITPTRGTCDDPRAPAVVAAACEGQNSCTLYQGAPDFPEDPCPNVPKALVVQAVCSAGDGAAQPPLTQWAGSTGGTLTSVTSSTATITGIHVGPGVLEAWTLDVSTGFAWSVQRSYGVDVAAQCDRGPTLVLNAEYDLSLPGGSQIPSLLDPDLAWDTANGCGYACTLGDGGDNGWSLGATPNSNGTLVFSPSLLSYSSGMACSINGSSSGSDCGLMFTWPNYPGVGGGETTMAVGLVPMGGGGVPGPRTVPANTTLSFSWAWAPAAANAQPVEASACPQGVIPFNFSHPDPAIQATTCRIAAIFNMWAGNIFGNSPASIVCLHEMSWFPLIQSIFEGSGGHTALQSELALFAQWGVRDDGYVFPRWAYQSYYAMPIHDQIGHFLTAYYWHAVNTGDAAFISSVWPTLMRVVSYINTTMMFGQNGLATTPAPASGLPNSNQAGNWFDIIDFGGRDAIVNAYICQGLNATAQLAAWIGDADNATALAAMHAVCAESFNALFWNETLGLYADWSDINGLSRYYGYIWQQALATEPLAGIANTSRAAVMANVVASRLAEIHVEYNKSDSVLWCAPTNLWPVAPADAFYNGTLQDQAEYGHYEAGACFVALHGMLVSLYDNAGQADAAFAALNATLSQATSSWLWGQHYDWVNSSPGFDGSDVLTDTLYVLRAALRATFGLRQSLGSLTAVPSGAAAAMEGASWVFTHMGQPVRATVVNRTSIIEYL